MYILNRKYLLIATSFITICYSLEAGKPIVKNDIKSIGGESALNQTRNASKINTSEKNNEVDLSKFPRDNSQQKNDRNVTNGHDLDANPTTLTEKKHKDNNQEEKKFDDSVDATNTTRTDLTTTIIEFNTSMIDVANFSNVFNAQLNVSIIPDDQLCLLCHLIMKQFKEKMKANLAQFKKDMISSCTLLNDGNKTKKCEERVSDSRLKRISKTTVPGLCIQEKLCKQGQKIKPNSERAAPAMEKIPELKREEKEAT